MPGRTHRALSVLAAPSNLGLMPPAEGREPGVGRMPEALLSHGLLDRLRATEVVTVPPPVYEAAVAPQTGVRNAEAVRSYAAHVAAAVERPVADGDFVLGGDCSILLGPLLALRRRGGVRRWPPGLPNARDLVDGRGRGDGPRARDRSGPCLAHPV